MILHKIISDREKDIKDAHAVAVRRRKSMDLIYLESRIKELSNAMNKTEIRQLWKECKSPVIHDM